MRTSAKRPLFWLLNAALVVACAKSGSLESEEGEDTGGAGGTSGRSGSGGSGFAGNPGVGGSGGVNAGGSLGVGGTSGAAGAAGKGGSGGTTAGTAGSSGTGGSGGSAGSTAGTGGSAGVSGSAGLGGSGGCGGNQTFCGGTCQALRPANGCGNTSCTECAPPPPNATAACYEDKRECGFNCNDGYARDGDRCVTTTCRAQDCPGPNPCAWWAAQFRCCRSDNTCGCQWPGSSCFEEP